MKLANCENPRLVYNKITHVPLVVNCGKCPACRSLKQKVWVDRLSFESFQNKYTYFFTLTYEDKNLPALDIDSFDIDSFNDFFTENYGSDISSAALSLLHQSTFHPVSKADVVKFIKRFRKYSSSIGAEVRYYVVSEYGPLHQRPHYHGLFFFDSDKLANSFHEIIHKAWKLGFLNWSVSRGGCGAYCAKYITSAQHGSPLHLYPDFRTFSLYSRKPPLATVRFGSETFRRFFFQEDYHFHIPTDTHVKDVSVWRSLENRIFPRPLGFGSLPYSMRASRLRLYEIRDTLKEIYKEESSLNHFLPDITKYNFISDVISDLNIPFSVYAFFHDLYYYKKYISCLSSFYSFQEGFKYDRRFLINLYPENYDKCIDSLTRFNNLPSLMVGKLKEFGFTCVDDQMHFGCSVEQSSALLSELRQFHFSNLPDMQEFFKFPRKIFKHDNDLRILNSNFYKL